MSNKLASFIDKAPFGVVLSGIIVSGIILTVIMAVISIALHISMQVVFILGLLIFAVIRLVIFFLFKK